MTRSEIDRLIDERGVVHAGVQCRVAAILFTYRCSIRCRHCLFGSAPDRPDVVMTAQQCAEGLGLLHETGRVIHIAGGEAMLYWDVLSEALRLAHERNIQTNCGMILGRLPETTPAAVLARGPEQANRFVTAVCEQGPRGLAELARREYGFVPPQRLTQTCELCYLARAFLRQFHPDVFGPGEVYG